jgi:hypothetical protein
MYTPQGFWTFGIWLRFPSLTWRIGFETDAILTKDTDLVQTGMDMLLDIVWRFAWRNPSEEVVRKDMSSLLSGRFPE